MTVELLLVRHAIAFERDRKRWHDDALRPLSPEGIKKFRKATAGIKRVMKPPKQVWTSPLVRALQTAAILSEVAEWPKAIEHVELSPDSTPQKVINLLRRTSVARVALVGHEPGLSQLAAFCLVGSDAVLRLKMKKGAVLALTFSGTPRAGGGTLQTLTPPRYLRSASTRKRRKAGAVAADPDHR